MAPGTWCSFIAFLTWYFLRHYIDGVFILYGSLVLFFVGAAVTTIYSDFIGEKDPGEIVIDELFNASKSVNSSLIIVTHDKKIAKKCHRTINIHDGKIIKNYSILKNNHTL